MGLGGGVGCNISASLGISINSGSPTSSTRNVTVEGGGGSLGKFSVTMSSDLNGNFGTGLTVGQSLVPYTGSVSISQQWTTTLFNVDDIVYALNVAYNPDDGWLSGFFYDLFYRSGNTPIVTPDPE